MTTYRADHNPDLVAKNTFSKDAKRFFDTFGGNAHHVKVGNIEIVILPGIDMWAAVVKESLTYTRNEFSEPTHFQRFRANRLDILDRIDFALAETHPLAAEIHNAIRAERNMRF